VWEGDSVVKHLASMIQTLGLMSSTAKKLQLIYSCLAVWYHKFLGSTVIYCTDEENLAQFFPFSHDTQAHI
jgi:hypothetical protein